VSQVTLECGAMRSPEAVITSVLEHICHVGKVLDSAWTVWTGTLVMFLSTCVLRLYSGSEGRRFDERLVKCWGMCCWEKTKECRSNFEVGMLTIRSTAEKLNSRMEDLTEHFNHQV
jgi:hypothetical protein